MYGAKPLNRLTKDKFKTSKAVTSTLILDVTK